MYTKGDICKYLNMYNIHYKLWPSQNLITYLKGLMRTIGITTIIFFPKSLNFVKLNGV
ncbi:MAG: hypothetical protein UT34_C0001G0158 [candidate division WS6 bacterium GW2011_GWF2_39_15]|uniref:Uncharacterized protein n=1 Tax=candidate division WS6 bacterium GW2011_GWF2_39_15 TaxID=1619100 RepID=A0A0G0MSK2_9BACT|nr:MAG: hypothetical protein UT34_C0001G0158 [candidate division WS6 bacterium GW2011_GWF2_39_15]